jgi:hypothetical protein
MAMREAVWEKTGVEPMGGCLYIGCLEKRIGRRLRDHLLNALPRAPRHWLEGSFSS